MERTLGITNAAMQQTAILADYLTGFTDYLKKKLMIRQLLHRTSAYCFHNKRPLSMPIELS